jgi:hypothetical protein
MGRLMMRLTQDEKEILRQERETEKMMEQEEKQQQKQERGMMGEEDKAVRKAEAQYKREEKAQKKIGQKEQAGFKKAQSFIQKRIAEEEAKQVEAQVPKKRGRPPKQPKSSGASQQQSIVKFMSQQAAKR